MKLLKILIYDTNYVKGISRVIPILKIKYWQKKDCEITILCTKEGENFYSSELSNISFIIIDYKYQIKNAYSLPWEYTKITIQALLKLKSMSGRFDIVYSQSSIIDFLFVPFVLTMFDRKVKWFVMVDNLVPPPHERPGPFLKKLIPYVAFHIGNILLKKSDGIFVVTNFLKNYYQKRHYNVIKTGDGYGIDTPIFTGAISSGAHKFDALYTGRLHTAKGVFDLIEVIKEVVKVKSNFKLGIMGDGEKVVKQNLKAKINEYNLNKNIIFTGYLVGKQKGDILRNTKLFIFLSYDEGCPHAVIEAFAVNKLVLAYNLPIYHSVFKKYIAKGQMLLFRKKDVNTIARVIISSSKKSINFTNNLSNYSWETIVSNELYSMKKIL